MNTYVVPDGAETLPEAEAYYLRPAADDDALEHAFHRLTLERWAERLCALWPRSYAERPLPDASTDALPGSPEKIAILTARAEAAIQLFHPADSLVLGYVKVLAGKLGGPGAPSGPKWRPDGTLRGVTLWRRGYRAQVQVDGENHHLGQYDTREDAEAVVLAFWRERGFEVPDRPLPEPQTTPRGWKGWKARQRAG